MNTIIDNEKYAVRDHANKFSATTEDAVAAAHSASAKAHEAGTKGAHERAARLHRLAAKRHADDGNAVESDLHEGIASGHDSMAASSHPALGNETVFRAEHKQQLALENNSAVDEDGWALIAPFGEHPKTRLSRDGNQIKSQKFVQVLDNESADALVSQENSFFSKLKRAVIGVPIFKGHGDLNDSDPQAIGNTNQKIKLGVIDKIRKAARGIEAHFALDNDGADAVKAGYKLPSALWWVLPIANEGDTIRCRPYKLISVALTQSPNISGVESLANDRLQIERGLEQINNTKPDMKLISGWLLAQGIALPNSEAPTETQVLEAFQKLHTAKAGEVVALGNEKQTLTGKITTAESEAAAQKKLATELTTALANEQTAHKASRTATAGVIADQAIRLGIKTVAEREATMTALANNADIAAAAAALLQTKPTHKTTQSGTDISGRQSAALGNEDAQTQAEYNAAFKTELPLNGQNAVAAHRAIMTLPKYSALAEKLRPKQM